MEQCQYCKNQINDNYKRCLNCDNIIKWCETLTKHWKNKDLSNLLALFDDKCECYDTPFSPKSNVEEDWQEIKTQEIKSIYKNILVIKEHECIVEFVIDYGNEICSAINHVKFNVYNSKCVYLKQWYMCEPKQLNK